MRWLWATGAAISIGLLGAGAGCGEDGSAESADSPSSTEVTSEEPACPPPDPSDLPGPANGGVPSPLPDDFARLPLARAEVLSVDGSEVRVRWQPGQGVEPCEVTLEFDRAVVLAPDGYLEIDADTLTGFVERRLAELPPTFEGVPFFVALPGDDGVVQLAETPPG